MLSRVLLVLLLAIPIAPAARAQTAATATVDPTDQTTYARMVFSFDHRPNSQITLKNSILVVRFDAPVDISVERVPVLLSRFISAARRDPDGYAVRFALARPLTMNSMLIGETLYLDLMGEGWKGFPPPLPASVLEAVTAMARETADAKAELKRMQQRIYQPLELHVGTHPTFHRLDFQLPEMIPVEVKREENEVSVTISAPLPFDVLEARTFLPTDMTNLQADKTDDQLVIRFTVDPAAEVRDFREDNSVVIDVTRVKPPEEPKPPAPVPAAPPAEEHAPPPAKAAPADAHGAPPAAAPAEGHGAPPAGEEHAPPSEGHAPKDSHSQLRDGERLRSVLAGASLIQSAVMRDEPPHVHLIQDDHAAPHETAPAPAAPPTPPAAASSSPVKARPAAEVKVQVKLVQGAVQFLFPFVSSVPAAAFQRGSNVWLVFDDDSLLQTEAILRESGGLITNVEQVNTEAGQALRMEISRSVLMTLSREDNSGTWMLALGDIITEPMRPLTFTPTLSDDGKASLRIGLEAGGAMHWINDPVVGDRLLVVTADPPARGVLRPQSFVEFNVLPSAQGLAFQPLVDDFAVHVGTSDVMVSREKGLLLSALVRAGEDVVPKADVAGMVAGTPFEPVSWRDARMLPFYAHENELIRVAAAAETDKELLKARVALARFYLTRDRGAEAKAVLDVVRQDNSDNTRDPFQVLIYGAALVQVHHGEDAVRELMSPPVADLPEAALWRAQAEMQLGRVPRAKEALQKGEGVLNAMPEDLQLMFRLSAVRIALEAHDYATAATQLDTIDALGVQEEQPLRTLMRGLVAEGLDNKAEAAQAYQSAAGGADPDAAAEARLRLMVLQFEEKQIKLADMVSGLEALSTSWRGDAVEAETLAWLSRLYAEQKRWREAFTTMRNALETFPAAPSSREVYNEMADQFARIFLADGADSAPPTLESVVLFYDFKELTPPGRRGDEMIRRLSDRLAEVDLLQPAAELLSYQIKNRLTGAARAQVAARAALLYLMNRQPLEALRVLQTTRQASLSNDLVRNRLILEAKALSETGRADLAMDLLAGYDGSDVARLRADVLWGARRWQQAAEALELLVGNRWEGDAPLDDTTRLDIVRTAVAYALAEDELGLDRIRAKFSAKMSNSPDAQTFDIITAPIESHGTAFFDLARTMAATNSLEAFITEYKTRYPETTPPLPDKTGAPPAGGAPAEEKKAGGGAA